MVIIPIFPRRPISFEVLGNTISLEDSNTLIIAQPENVIIHEHYNPINRENNIALIKLSQEFSGQYVRSVAIFTDSTISNHSGQLLGLGFVSQPSFYPNTLLKKVNLTQQQCQEGEKNSVICTKGTEVRNNEQELCFGEFGGPLYDIQSETVIGVTKAGTGLCGQPAINEKYSRISLYADWIYDNVMKT